MNLAFNLYTRRTRGRAVVGDCALRQITNSKGPNLNILLAVSLLVGVLLRYSLRCHKCVMVSTFSGQPGMDIGTRPSVTVVMDNAGVHNKMQLDNLISVKKLPAYSPFLNPIKHSFPAIKVHVKAVLNEPVVVAKI